MRRGHLLFAGSLLALSCAQVRPINGGEKDVEPPTLVAAVPANGSVRFNGSNIRLEFDERIQLDRVRENALISPPLDAPPDVRIVGSKSVEIRLNAPLKANSTYIFQFGSAIKDLTEGNTSPNLNYVLSTGPTLDSLTVAGAVVDAFTGVPEKGMFVFLYAAEDSTSFRTGRPLYMARTDALGVFAFGHLPAGNYRLYALRDMNGNLRYDLPNEAVAFLDTTLALVAGVEPEPVMLRSFLPESPVQLVRSSKVLPDGALQVALARGADTIGIRDIGREGGELQWRAEWNGTRDTVLLWPSDTTLVSAGWYELSDATAALDTVRYRPLARMPFRTGLGAVLQEEASGAWIRMQATRPIARMDTARVQLTQDSIAMPFVLEPMADPRVLAIQARIEPGSSVILTLLPRFVHDIYGGTNDTVRVALGRAAEKATGTLRIAMKDLPDEGPFILQLLDPQQRVVRGSSIDRDQPAIKWERLSPGTRTLRLIADVNGNGRWDTGVPDERQPERTWYHVEPVNIRAAWDIVVDWSME